MGMVGGGVEVRVADERGDLFLACVWGGVDYQCAREGMCVSVGQLSNN